jgi:uridine kinase
MKTVVLVNGVPASGKTTVTRQLSERFSLPILTIDGIKEPFMAQFSEIDRAFNRKAARLMTSSGRLFAMRQQVARLLSTPGLVFSRRRSWLTTWKRPG